MGWEMKTRVMTLKVNTSQERKQLKAIITSTQTGNCFFKLKIKYSLIKIQTIK